MKKPTYTELARKLRELQAQQPSTLRAAHKGLQNVDRLHGGACIVTITALGGRDVVEPFAIYDGFSQSTIDAMKADIQRTIDRICKV
jgi:hypothetical protein